MTTKPKARKYRIRRNAPLGFGNAAQQIEAETGPADPEAAAAEAPAAGAQTAQSQTAPQQAAPQTAPAQPGAQPVAQDGTAEAAAEIDAIRREGLTGRQLRMARRVAQRHGLPATSDFDAVRLLRARGIDPFQRANMLELVVPEKDKDAPSNLPQTAAPGAGLPSTDMLSPSERRLNEVAEIQRDIVRRRRRKLRALMARLAVFVFLPTLVAGWYYYAVATPLYATKTEFLIQQAEGQAAGGLGSLLPTQFNTNQDSIAVQGYLGSRDAMLRLDADEGFKQHFADPGVDAISRLPEEATNERAYKLYKKMVKIGYDPSEGMVKMEVIAADPETSQRFSEALIRYAEERVDNLTSRKRADQMAEAESNLLEAEEKRREAQRALVALQQEAAIVDPEGRIAALRSQITQREIELQEKQLQLQALLDNPRPNQSRVDGVQGDIRRLQGALAELNARMNDATTGEDSLASISAQVQLAQADLATRDLMLQSALQNLEAAQIEANRQTRYLSRAVDPVAPDQATYPRKFENTVLAFLIFSGIYLMVSLTASILREQVSS